jgi:hypothetical protein
VIVSSTAPRPACGRPATNGSSVVTPERGAIPRIEKAESPTSKPANRVTSSVSPKPRLSEKLAERDLDPPLLGADVLPAR